VVSQSRPSAISEETRISVRIIRLLLLGAAVAVSLAACGGAAPSGSPVIGDITVVAQDMKFDRAQVQVPANRPFTFAFRNRDSMPHNIAIYTDDSATTKVFIGQIITGSETLYRIPALKPGTYFFRCDVHPSMTGSIVAR